MIYVGITYEYDLPDGTLNNDQGYGIWRTNTELDNTFNRIDGNTCRQNVMGQSFDPFCRSNTRIVRLMSMDYFDRLTSFTSHTNSGSQEAYIGTSYHDFIFQCNGIGNTDHNLFKSDTFKTINMHTGFFSYKRFIGMYHKDSVNVYGVLQDVQNQGLYFINVKINSVTDCNTYDVYLSNKQLVEFFAPNDRVTGTHAAFIYNPAGGSEQEFAVAGYSTKNEWCNNGYNSNAPNNKQFGYIGAITYKCGFFKGVTQEQHQTHFEYYYNKFDVAGKVTGTPVDVTSAASNGLTDMTLTVGTTITNTFPGCKFCCNSISPPGSINVGGRYPDKLFYATDSSNTNTFSTDIREFLTFSDEVNCPPTFCQMNKGTECSTGLGTTNLNPRVTTPASALNTQVQFTHNPNILSTSLTLPASDDVCIKCGHSIDWGATQLFKITLDCGTISGSITPEFTTDYNQQAFVLDTDSTLEPEFIFKRFKNSIPECPVESYCVSSTGSDPCTLHSKLKSTTQNFVHGPTQYGIKLNNYLAPDTATFYIKVSAKSNNGPRFIYTTAMTYTLVCGPDSTTILDSPNYFSLFQEYYPNVTAKFKFYKSSLTNVNCPITEYKITMSPNSYVAPTISTQPQGQIGLKDQLDPYNMPQMFGGTLPGFSVSPADYSIDEQLYNFYIYIKATGGAFKYSEMYTLSINARCELQELSFRSQKNVVLVQNSTELWPHKLDISKNFYSGDWIYCPIIRYEVWNVYNGSTWLQTPAEKLWEKKFKFDEKTAVLTFYDTTELIDLWHIYVVAWNKKIRSTEKIWPVSFKVIPGPKFKPQFINFDGQIVLNVAQYLEGSRTRYKYQIPETFDGNKYDTVNVTVVNASEPFMKVDYKLMQIYFDDLTLDNIGNYKIPFLLEDDDKLDPQFNDEYTLYVKIECRNTLFFKECPVEGVLNKTNNATQVVEKKKDDRPKNQLWANITSLTQSGLMTIKFRDYMQTKKFGEFNVTELAKWFNNETFSIYVIRSNPEFFDNPKDDPDLLYYNLSYYCVKYYEDEMQLQIDFEHPLWISQHEFRDTLHVYLINHTYFRSNYTRSPNWLKSPWELQQSRMRKLQPAPYMNFSEEFQDNFNIEDIDELFDEEGREYEFTLSLNYTNLRVSIPKQLPPPVRPYVVTNQIFAAITLAVTFLAFFVGFIFFRICWILLIAAILSLQVVAHLPLLKVIMPANTILAFEDIIPIALFDWLGLDFWRTRWFARMWFNFDFLTHQQLSENLLFAQARDLGWDNYSMVLILGSFFTFWTFYFFRMFYLGIFKSLLLYWRGKDKISKKSYRKLEKSYIQRQNRVYYSNFIMIFLVSLFEILIGGVLNFNYTLTSTAGDRFSALFTVFLFIIITMMLVPKFTYFIMTQPLIAFQKDKKTRLALSEEYYWFQRKFSAFWWRQPRHNKWQLAYSIVFMLRRVIFVFFVFKCALWLQITGTLAMNFAIAIYYGNFKPKKQRLEFRMELFNEIMIYVITYHLLLLSNWVIDPEVRYLYGWSMGASMLFMVAGNYIVLGYFTIKYGYILIRKYIQWFTIMRYLMNLKYNHNRNEKNEEEPMVSCFHVFFRKALFKIGFFWKINQYEVKEEEKEEYIEAVNDCIKEINTMKFGFAYTYPYRVDNELPQAKSSLHAKIREGFMGLLSSNKKQPAVVSQQIQQPQQDPKFLSFDKLRKEREQKPAKPMDAEKLKKIQALKDLLKDKKTEQLAVSQKPTCQNKCKDFFKKHLSFLDYNKLLKMKTPSLVGVADDYDEIRGRRLNEQPASIPTILDHKSPRKKIKEPAPFESFDNHQPTVETQPNPVKTNESTIFAKRYLNDLTTFKLDLNAPIEPKQRKVNDIDLFDNKIQSYNFDLQRKKDTIKEVNDQVTKVNNQIEEINRKKEEDVLNQEAPSVEVEEEIKMPAQDQQYYRNVIDSFIDQQLGGTSRSLEDRKPSMRIKPNNQQKSSVSPRVTGLQKIDRHRNSSLLQQTARSVIESQGSTGPQNQN